MIETRLKIVLALVTLADYIGITSKNDNENMKY